MIDAAASEAETIEQSRPRNWRQITGQNHDKHVKNFHKNGRRNPQPRRFFGTDAPEILSKDRIYKYILSAMF